MKRNLPLFVMAIAFLFSIVVVQGEDVSAQELSDIPDKYATEVNYLIDNNVISGYPDGTFKPNNSVSRAEATSMIGRVLELDGTQRETAFQDVPAASFASGYIDSANEADIVGGVAAGQFAPDSAIKRGDMAILLSNAFNLTEMNDSISFTDVDSSHYHYNAVNKLAAAGITGGYGDGTYRPGESITRVEFSLMVARAMNDDFRSSPPTDDSNTEDEDDSQYESADTEQSVVKFVDAASLTVRSGPGVSNASVGSLPESQAVTVHTGTRTNGWVEITGPGVSGFVNESYLSESAPQQDPAPEQPEEPAEPEEPEEPETPAEPEGEDITKYVGSSTSLNVRSGPGTSYNVVSSMPTGQEVTVHTETRTNNGWVEITSGNTAGYVNEGYLDNSAPDITKYVGSTTPLNVRGGPDTSHGVIGSMPTGQAVTVHPETRLSNGWVKITSGNLNGYVNEGYLDSTKPASPSPDAPGKTVVLDPGHGAHDPGASGNGIQEKDIVLDVGQRTQGFLEDMGYNVIMTRSDDTFLELSERTALANNSNTDIFVSIHANAASPSATGTETYYSTSNPYQSDSSQLSTFIQDRMVQALGLSDRGVKTQNFYVIRNTNMPSSLLEMGFLTNGNDANVLSTHKNALAEGIALGINDYFNWKG